ncbi:MAG: MBL fold metallo-hydrolase [Armatimonadetes bacterium]|nr:MBL fold metallo-hydrolase [Armatimonadota bacterium]
MEIAPGIHSLRQNQGGHVHAFLIDDGSELTLIDTLYDTDARRVVSAIEGLGRSTSDLRHIILTHAHRSHLGGLAALKRLSGATVYAHEWEADIIAGERKAQGITLRPMHPLLTWLPVYPLQLGLTLGLAPHPPCPVDQWVEDGDRIGPLQVLHTPGHSPGHLAFHWPERRALFAGDAVATWPKFSPGWPAFNLNTTEHRRSLGRMAALDVDVVAVGHGEPITAAGTERVRDAAAMA